MKRLMTAALFLALGAMTVCAESKEASGQNDMLMPFMQSLTTGLAPQPAEVAKPALSAPKHERYLFCRVYPPKFGLQVDVQITADILSDSRLANVLIQDVHDGGFKTKTVYTKTVEVAKAGKSTLLGTDPTFKYEYRLSFLAGEGLATGQLGPRQALLSVTRGGATHLDGQTAYCHVKPSQP